MCPQEQLEECNWTGFVHRAREIRDGSSLREIEIEEDRAGGLDRRGSEANIKRGTPYFQRNERPHSRRDNGWWIMKKAAKGRCVGGKSHDEKRWWSSGHEP
jgi:hypothetical protein